MVTLGEYKIPRDQKVKTTEAKNNNKHKSGQAEKNNAVPVEEGLGLCMGEKHEEIVDEVLSDARENSINKERRVMLENEVNMMETFSASAELPLKISAEHERAHQTWKQRISEQANE